MGKSAKSLRLCGEPVSLAALPDHPVVRSKKDYEAQLEALQRELLRIQRAYYREGRRAILVFEGWDAAGKGGAIRRLTEKLDPRGFRVFPIGPPSHREQARHYLWRFWQHVPLPGTLAIFDRSYYGRVLVERVEGLADKPAWRRAYGEINQFEETLIDDGIAIVKCFLHVTPGEQLRRFEERLKNPDKRWKLTVDDIRNRQRWDDYQLAIEAMLEQTASTARPWHLVLANHKWHARLAVLTAVVKQLGEGVAYAEEPIDPAVREAAESLLGIDLS